MSHGNIRSVEGERETIPCRYFLITVACGKRHPDRTELPRCSPECLLWLRASQLYVVSLREYVPEPIFWQPLSVY